MFERFICVINKMSSDSLNCSPLFTIRNIFVTSEWKRSVKIWVKSWCETNDGFHVMEMNCKLRHNGKIWFGKSFNLWDAQSLSHFITKLLGERNAKIFCETFLHGTMSKAGRIAYTTYISVIIIHTSCFYFPIWKFALKTAKIHPRCAHINIIYMLKGATLETRSSA